MTEEDWDDGTMPANVETLEEALVGQRVVKVTKEERPSDERWYGSLTPFILTLSDGTEVRMYDTDDCCAFTSLEQYTQHLPELDHIITKVTADENFDVWHIFADWGEILTLDVGWSPGNPFYYGYGFDIRVVKAES